MIEILGADKLKEFKDEKTGSGTPMGRFFCGTCGCPIKSVTSAYPGKSVVKLGMFPTIPHPEAEAFASRRQQWEGPYEGAGQFKTKPFGEKLQ
ncbi:MAG: hypothetical protein M1827_006493 [Pycnora praestabilis]|nr:MAG: hypothetical protein M1827_006493 [Pycnora praestabilis]